MSLDLDIKLPVSKPQFSVIWADACLWGQLKWTLFSKTVCHYWFGFGNKGEWISISALSWVYPNKPTSFTCENSGANCWSLECTPIWPCVLITCGLNAFKKHPSASDGEHALSEKKNAWKPAWLFHWTSRLDVTKSRHVKQGAVLSVEGSSSWPSGRELGEEATWASSPGAPFRALFSEPAGPLLPVGIGRSLSWKARYVYF